MNKEIIESQNGVIPFTDNSLNSNNNYWTSSEAEGAKALSINFLNGNTNANPKETINKVRAVRSF